MIQTAARTPYLPEIIRLKNADRCPTQGGRSYL